MLECTACGSRCVVHDSYLEFVGTSDPNPPDGAGYGGPPLSEQEQHEDDGDEVEFGGFGDLGNPGAGYGGPPLPERYTCAKGCSRPMKAIGSIFDADDEEMWLHEPHVSVKMTKAQSDEWRQLIQAAGLTAPPREALPPVDLVFRIRTPGIPVREVRVESPSVTIGNKPGARLQLDGDDRVSRMHALVEVCTPNEVVVFDLGSRTGTWINGRRIITNARLESGGVLEIGATAIEVEIVPRPVG